MIMERIRVQKERRDVRTGARLRQQDFMLNVKYGSAVAFLAALVAFALLAQRLSEAVMLEMLSGGLLGSSTWWPVPACPGSPQGFMDKGNERKHELAMFTLQTDLEKMPGQFKMEEKYADYSVNQLDAIKEAFVPEQAADCQGSRVGGGGHPCACPPRRYTWAAALHVCRRQGCCHRHGVSNWRALD
jgi:hypothetical protein